MEGTDRASGASKTAKGLNLAASGFGSLFQTLSTWDNSAHHSRLATIAGIIIEAIQFCAFAIGPVYMFKQPVVYEFTVAVFAFLIPIWDRSYGPFEYGNYIIPVAILVALLILGGGIFLSFVTKAVEQSDFYLTQGSRILLESLSSWMLLPALHIFMGGVMCDGSTLHNFRQETCWTSLHVATSLVAAGGILLTFVFGIIIATTLGDPHPQSNHLRSRPHNYVELLVFVVKTALVILYHLLVESGSPGAFSIILVIASLLLLVAHVMVLPFYHSEVTRVRCVTYAVTAFAATINCITSYTGFWFVTHRLNSFALVGLLPLAVVFGYIVHDIRPSKQLLHNLNCLLNHAAVPTHKARFPFRRGIMSQDTKLAPIKYRSLEDDLLQEFAAGSELQEDGAEADLTWAEIVAQSTEVLVPYVDSVFLSTDAELATRYLEMHRRITNLSVSANPLAFALRIFMKSILLFPRSGVTRFHFALFLFVYANKHNLALEVLLEVQNQVHDEHDILVHYNVHKYVTKIRQLFGARDETHIHAFKRARQLHKESLSTMNLFWSKLMESKVDLTVPALLTNQITSKREAARLEYERALAGDTSNDRLLLSTYATFLEQVMCDPTAADQFRQLAEDAAEEKRQRLMRGSKSKRNFGDRKADVKVAATTTSAAEDDDDEQAAAIQRSSMVQVVGLGFAAVGIFSIGMCVLAFLYSASAEKQLMFVSKAGVMLHSSAESELFILLAAKNCVNSTMCDVKYLGNLSAAEAEFRVSTNKVTYGSYGPKDGSKAYTIFTGESEIVLNSPVGGVTRHEYQTLGNPASPAFSVLEHFSKPILSMDSLWIASKMLSVALTDFVNLVASRQEYVSSFQYILLNAKQVEQAAKIVVLAAETDFQSDAGLLWGSIALFAAGVVSLGICYVMFVFNVQDIALTKTNTLKLFTLIPYPTQEMLCSQAKARLESFEKVHSEQEEVQEMDHDMDEEEEQEANSPAIVEPQSHGKQQINSKMMRKSVLSLSAKPGKQLDLFDDADERKLSRFFGKSRANSNQPHHVLVPILKKVAGQKNTKRRVKFSIQGEAQQPSASQKKKLAEPKVNIDSPANLIDDFEKSIIQIEKDLLADQCLEKQKRDLETEKLLRGEINSERATIRKAGAMKVTAAVTEESMKADEEALALLHNERVLTGAKIVMALVVLATLGIIVFVFVQRNAIAAYVDDSLERQQDLTQYAEMVEKLVTNANYFSAFGTSTAIASQYYNQFFDSLTKKEFMSLVDKYSEPRYERIPVFTEDLNTLAQQALRIVYLSMKVMAQAARGNGNSIETVTLLSTFNDEADRCLSPTFIVKFPSCEEFPSEFAFPSLTELVDSESADRVTLLSLRQATSFRRRQLLKEFMEQTNQTALKVRAHFSGLIASAASTQNMLVGAALGITAFSAVFYMIRVFLMHGDERERAIKVTLVLARFATVATLAVALSISAGAKDHILPYEDAFQSFELVRTAFFNRHNDYALRYAVSGDDLTLLLMEDSLKIQRDVLPQLQKDASRLGVVASISTFEAQDQALRTLQQVSAFLSYTSFAKQNGVFPWVPRNDPRFMSTYDFQLESNSEEDRVKYASDPNIAFMYSSAATDPSRNASMLLAMSRFAVFGRRGFDYYSAAYKTLTEEIGDAFFAKAHADSKRQQSDFTYYIIISLALSAYGSLCAIAIASLPIVDSFIRSRAAAEHSEDMRRSLFGRVQFICTLAMAGVGAVLAVQLAIIVVGTQPTADSMRLMENTRHREFSLTKSLIIALNLNNSVHRNAAFEMAFYSSDLSNFNNILEDVRSDIYFFPSSPALGKVEAMSAAQKDITFGGNNSLDVQYQQWRSQLASLVSIIPVVSLAEAGPLGASGNKYVISSAIQTSISSTAAAMLSAYPSLRDLLRRSSEQFESDTLKAVNASVTPNIILCIALILALLLELRFVFFDVSVNLDKEELGTRLTLNMIPQNVRELIPKISLYLETGTLIEENEESSAYVRTSYFTDFIKSWGNDAPAEECFANLDKCTSNYAFIVINSQGIVQYQNKHAILLLGFDDFVGRNISIILEEPLRSLHDGFLRRFIQQGTSRIVGMGRDVVATAKNGTRVHMYLYLDAAVRSNGDVFFIGQLERYDMEKLKEKQN
jgi:PAS domain S-box-containing protein